MIYLYLFIAIVFEVVATIALKESHGFTKIIPSLLVVIGYSIAFYLLTIIVQKMPLSVAYGIWSGVGLLTVMLISVYWYKQVLDLSAYLGIGFILLGVILIRFFSNINLSN